MTRVTGWRKASHSIGNANCAEVAAWRKASHSNGHECVEVATILIPMLAVRDTKDEGTGPVLTFTADSWAAFTARVKAELGASI